MNIEVIVSPDKRDNDGFAETTLIFDGNYQRILDISYRKLFNRCRNRNTLAIDFLFISSICYIVDKSVNRSTTFDLWTRELDVTIPVHNLGNWITVKNELEKILRFLTGDLWTITFKQLDVILYRSKRKTRKRKVSKYRLLGLPTATCLFSGGLDSLIGAINLLADSSNNRVLLIGHYDTPGAKSDQSRLFESIWDEYKKRVELLQIRVAHTPIDANEMTLRSRSLVFIALGMYVANAFNNNIPLYTPENGLIALNIPITPSREGSCSTRTMHPYFISKLSSLLNRINLSNDIINPFRLKTKGECAIECSNQNLLKAVVNDSVSCSHASRKQNWERMGSRNCGYCIPCIIRRAALHKANIDNKLKYGIDCNGNEIDIEDKAVISANDLRAMKDFIQQGYDSNKLKTSIKQVATIDDLGQYVNLAKRGFDEIRKFFRDNN